MKKRKVRIGEALLEILVELLMTLIFFGIGALILYLFGVNLDAPSLDGDLIVLLGIVAFAAVFGAIFALVAYIKKIFTKKRG